MQSFPPLGICRNSFTEAEMTQKGSEKQQPEDQRSRGKNPEHQEGQTNQTNHERQVQQPVSPGRGGANRAAGG
jgi:hypothetical protein